MASKLKFTIAVLCYFSAICSISAQITSDIIVYNFESQSYDSLSAYKYDPSIKRLHTDHFCGEKTIVPLDEKAPSENLIDKTEFTNLVPLTEIQSELAFPYTTGVKVVIPGQGDKHQATGVMVGDRFVLTTGHSTLRKYTNEVLFEQLDVIAAYDFNLSGEEELRSAVSKIYFVKDWRIGEGEDLVLLELAEPIGNESGWMSIGFEQDPDKLKNQVYHKMSYPAYNTPYNSKPYTGDDLHYSYGVADYVSPEFIGVQDHLIGLGGESGSPIFKTNNKDEFITYGVLTFLGNYNHTRIRPSIYFPFEEIITGKKLNGQVSPIELEKFEVSKLSGNQVYLNWDLAEKEMFTEYEIERSYDGEYFQLLSIVDAADIKEERGYVFIDKKPLEGLIHYRLKGVDNEEVSNFLDVKTVSTIKESFFEVSIYPNPTVDVININTKKEIDEPAELFIYGSDGRSLVNKELKSTNIISTSTFGKGVYHVVLRNQNVKESFSFVVR